MLRHLPAAPTRGRGQAMVEFALVAPIFFAMLFGIIELGRAVYYIQTVNNAAREGARYAIVHGGDSADPSGPTIDLPGLADFQGANVEAAVTQQLVGIDPTTVSVMRCWNGTPPMPASTPCDNDEDDYGPGFNQRGSAVYVRVTAEFRTLLDSLLPLPAITITGESTLVINH